MTTSHEHLRVEWPTNGVVLAILNRPERRNALTREMFDCLAALQADVDAEPAARVLVLTGAGLGFCAGIDLDIAAELPRWAPTSSTRSSSAGRTRSLASPG